MNFEFSDERNLLREQVQNCLREQCEPEKVRAVLGTVDITHDAGLWQSIVDLG